MDNKALTPSQIGDDSEGQHERTARDNERLSAVVTTAASGATVGAVFGGGFGAVLGGIAGAVVGSMVTSPKNESE